MRHILMFVILSGGCARYDVREIAVYKDNVLVRKGLTAHVDTHDGPEEYDRISYLMARERPLCIALERVNDYPKWRRAARRALGQLDSMMIERERTAWMKAYELRCCTVAACPDKLKEKPPEEAPGVISEVIAGVIAGVISGVISGVTPGGAPGAPADPCAAAGG